MGICFFDFNFVLLILSFDGVNRNNLKEKGYEGL